MLAHLLCCDSGSLYSGFVVEFNFCILYIFLSDFIYMDIKFIHYCTFFALVTQFFWSPSRKRNNHKEGGNHVTSYIQIILTFFLFFHYIHIISIHVYLGLKMIISQYIGEGDLGRESAGQQEPAQGKDSLLSDKHCTPCKINWRSSKQMG